MTSAHASSRRRRLSQLVVLASMSLLTACAGRSGVGGIGGEGGLFGPALDPVLASERDRLSALFAGTPVVVEGLPPQQLRLAVPSRFAFDPGRYAVKPALLKVLQEIGRGVATRTTVTVRAVQPLAEKATERLLEERAQSLRDALIGYGVPARRLTIVPQPGTSDQVELILSAE